MNQKTFNLINGILNIFFGIFLIFISYFMFGEEFCDGGKITLPLIIPFIVIGFGFFIIGIIRLNRKIKKR